MAQPGHLQTSTGNLRIGLDLRNPTVPNNPDFRFRIGRKIRKTGENRKKPKRLVATHFKALFQHIPNDDNILGLGFSVFSVQMLSYEEYDTILDSSTHEGPSHLGFICAVVLKVRSY